MSGWTQDMLAGLLCAECGVFFEKEHGHPVLCAHCWAAYAEKGETLPEGYSKARHGEL